MEQFYIRVYIRLQFNSVGIYIQVHAETLKHALATACTRNNSRAHLGSCRSFAACLPPAAPVDEEDGGVQQRHVGQLRRHNPQQLRQAPRAL